MDLCEVLNALYGKDLVAVVAGSNELVSNLVDVISLHLSVGPIRVGNPFGCVFHCKLR